MAAADFAPNPRDSCVLRGDADATHAASVAANSHARTHPRRSVAFRRAEACISSRYGSVTSPSIGFRGSYRAPPWRVEAVARRCEARRSASPTLNARAGLPTVAVVARGKKKKKRDRRVQTKLRESWSRGAVEPSRRPRCFAKVVHRNRALLSLDSRSNFTCSWWPCPAGPSTPLPPPARRRSPPGRSVLTCSLCPT